MADGDSGQFGSGLNFSGDQQPPAPPQNSDQQPQSSGFGGSFLGPHGSLFGPRYDPAPPNSSPLDAAANQLRQQSERAQWIATNPWAQIFGGADEARQAIPQIAEKWLAIQQQKQHQIDIQQRAVNQGLRNPGQFGAAATDDTLANEQLRQWKEEGSYNAYLALQGTSPEWAARANLYAPEAIGKLQQHIGVVQQGLTALNAAAQHRDQQAYDSVRNGLSDQDWGSIGLKPGQVPQKVDDWKRSGAAITAKYSNADRMVSNFFVRQNQLGQAVPITDEKVAGRIEGSYQFSNSEQVPGFKAVTLPGYGDQQGVQGPPGSKDINNFGKTWNTASPDQIKTVTGQLGADEVKGLLSKYKISRDFVTAANNPDLYKSAAGMAYLSDALGAVGRDVAEGTKAAGSIGLTKMLEAKYGNIDKARNTIANETAALKEWFGKPASQRAAPPSIEGIKAVANFNHQELVKEASERLSQPFKTAGRYGMNLEDLGLSKELTGDPQLLATYNSAVANSKREIAGYPMVAVGDRRVMLPTGSSIPGATTAAPVQQPSSPPAAGNPSTMGATGGTFGPAAGGGPTRPDGTPSPPVGGSTPGRSGLPPGMKLDNPQALDAAANRTIQMESGFKPNQKTGSYVGLGQWSKGEMLSHGITDPDDVEQTRTALKTDMQTRAAKLTKDGFPATAANVYLMHQQGEAGLEAHLHNPDGVAWQNLKPYYRTDSLAKQAVWGNMTPTMRAAAGGDVNKVTSGDFTRLWEARYNGTDAPTGAAAGARMLASGSTEAPPLSANQRAPRMTEAEAISKNYGEMPWYKRVAAGLLFGRDAEGGVEATKQYGPEGGSIVGAMAGGMAGPAGVVGGGAAGGAGGQILKDWFSGNPQNPTEIAKQGALGGVLGVAPEGRPVVGALTRTLGAGAVEGGAKAIEGGDAGDVAEAATQGAAGAGLSEMFGRALGMAGHKVWSMFSPDAQTAIQSAAKKFYDADEVLKTEQPKIAGPTGAAPNPKYDAADKARTEAETVLKDAGLKPDEAAYAHKVTAEGVPQREAEVTRPAAVERARIGAGYQQLEGEMGTGRAFRDPAAVLREAELRPPQGQQTLPDGPIAVARTAKMSPAMQNTAERAEMAVTAPAKDWREKWVQLKDARSALLDLERDAMTSTTAGRTQTAQDYRALADGVRKQQEKAATFAFGDQQGGQMIARLKVLDTRYARLMDATNGMQLDKAAALKGEAGRQADRAFRAFAQNDQSALKAWDAMRVKAGTASAGTEQSILSQIRLENVPGIGKYLAAGKSALDLAGWAREKAAGNPARFEDLVPELAAAKAERTRTGRTVRDLTGYAGARLGVGAMTQ
jgi:hypothetical protein